MKALSEQFETLEALATTATTFLFPGGYRYTGPIRPVGIIRQTSNDSRPIPKRKDGGQFQNYLVLADDVPLDILGYESDGSEPYPTGIVLVMLNDDYDFLDWSPDTKTIDMLQMMGTPWCSDGSMESACAESSGRFTWEIIFKPGPDRSRRRSTMLECKVCGNSKIQDSETICPDCGNVLAPPAAEAATGAAVQAATTPSRPAPAPPPVAPAPVASAISGTGAARASLTIFRGGALTNEKLTWPGTLVVVGKFDVDEGPVDVDLSQIPEAGYVSRRHCQIWCDTSGHWLVKDLGSSNNTFVRPSGTQKFQKAAGDQPLNDGDELALGNARFVFHIEPTHA